MIKRTSMVIIAAALVASLWAVPAYAANLAVADTTATADTTAAEPGTVDVYVLSKIGDMKCTYNGNGLLTKRANSSTTVTFKYSGTNIKSYTSKFKHGRSKSTTKGTLTYNKKGQLTKLVEKGSNTKSTDTYTYKSGRVSKCTHKATKQKKVKYSYAYDEQGRMSKRSASGGDKTKIAYAYDKQGNMKTATYSYGTRSYAFEYTNKYNSSNRLTKKTTKLAGLGSWSTATKYTYKQITIPAQYAQAVADQQWALLNPQVSFSYPLSY